MNQFFRALLIAALLPLGACGLVPPQPADPGVTATIASACADSGLFKLLDGTLTVFVPAATLPVSVVNAGVDKVCANPGLFASDVSTAEWVVRNTLGK